MLNNRLSFKRNLSWVFLGNVFYAITQWLILVVIAKLGNVEMVGLFSLGLALTAPVIMLTNLQLRSVQATDTQDRYRFSDFLALRIITNLVALLLIIIMIFTLKYQLYQSIIILLITLLKIVESLSDVIFGLWQKNEKMDYIGKSKIYKGFLSVLIIAILLFVTDNLAFSLIGLIVSWTLLLFLYDLKFAKSFTSIIPVFNKETILALVKLSLPLGIVLMLISLNSNIPKLLIESILGIEQLGYYSAMVYIVVSGTVVIQSLGQVATPRLAQYFDNKKNRAFNILLSKLVFIAMVIGALATLVAYFLGDLILTIFYDSSYSQYSEVFTLIMFGSIFTYISSILGYGITATKSFKVQPYIGLALVITNLILGFYLIPIYGLVGASWTIIISMFIKIALQCIVLMLVSNKKNENNNLITQGEKNEKNSFFATKP